MRDPFHSGERAIQEQTGEREVALINGQMIADRIPSAAKGFVAQQQNCVLGWSSPDRDVWATFLLGPRGFARTDGERQRLCLRLVDDNGTLPRNPVFAGIRKGHHLGALFIELTTRRRLRVNGSVVVLTNEGIAIAIDQAHALCPKYIQRRQPREGEPGPAAADILQGDRLDEALTAWATGADTFFVASAHPDGRADVSHRGGRPGFVQARNGALRIPDYPGNSLFNTLGNFALNPRAGLTFVDFGSNRQLQMTGDIRLDLETDGPEDETGGTGRWWEFTPRRWIVAPLNKLYTWEFIDPSPFNP